MRSSTTTFLANQNAIFKEAVKKRLRPLLPDDGVFENMFASMKLDIDCLNPNNLPVVDNDLTSGLNGILIKKSISDWIKAECKRRVELKRSFYDIDAFYKFNNENFEDFCSSPERAEAVLESKLKSLANALRSTDDIATEIFEDLSRSPNIIPQPLPLSYEAYLDTTKQTLLQEFLSRINSKHHTTATS